MDIIAVIIGAVFLIILGGFIVALMSGPDLTRIVAGLIIVILCGAVTFVVGYVSLITNDNHYTKLTFAPSDDYTHYRIYEQHCSERPFSFRDNCKPAGNYLIPTDDLVTYLKPYRK